VQDRGCAPSLALRLPLYGLVLLTAAVALLRRLNFDEALALRAGWLLAEGIPAEPNFYMPFTLAVGTAAHWIQDPGTLFLGLRLFCLFTVLGALAWGFFESGLGRGTVLLAMLLVLGHWSFLGHAFEFRYDWAILVGLALAYGALVRREEARYALLGALVAWLAAHHLKGVYFGALVYGAALLRMAFWDGFRRRALLALHLTAVGVVAAWVLISAATGHWQELVGVYREFFQVATGSEKVWPWVALRPALLRDIAWWLAVAAALTGLGATFLRAPGRPRLDLSMAFLFALGSAGFWFLHPHPWPYMIALPVPFLALLLAEGIDRLYRHYAERRAVAWGILSAGALVLITLQMGLGYLPGGGYLAALASPMDDQVATLRALRKEARPGDRVLDPSGLVYFLPPVTSQWYLDALFAERARQGLWMTGEEIPDAPGQWALLTYRLEALPASLNRQARLQFVPVGGGLALSRSDPRINPPSGEAPLQLPLAHSRLESFW
jgi:hypothetical protein